MAIDLARRRAAHLLRRAGFGATAAELDDWARLSFDDAVERLLAAGDDQSLNDRAFGQGYDLTIMDGYRAIWLYRMLHTTQPLSEKIALFWHGHFATSNAKVNRPGFMYDQSVLFRRQGLGSFADLLRSVARDPAMMIWLDLVNSRVGRPNENFARELMELFTLGIGAYTERDVQEAARAWTGWVFQDGQVVFVPRRHDAGEKTVLGRTGRLTGEDIIDILLAHPETARTIARKAVRFFVSIPPDEALVARLADAFRASGYQIDTLLRELFRAPEFSAEGSYHALIKSPAEFVIGTLKHLGMTQITLDHGRAMRAMGQDLFAPPTVKGWGDGPAWLNTTSLQARMAFTNVLTSARDARGADVPSFVAGLKAQSATTPATMVDAWLDWLVEGDVTPAMRATLTTYLTAGVTGPFTLTGRAGDSKSRGLLHLILSSPAYHLN